MPEPIFWTTSTALVYALALILSGVLIGIRLFSKEEEQDEEQAYSTAFMIVCIVLVIAAIAVHKSNGGHLLVVALSISAFLTGMLVARAITKKGWL